MTQRHTIGLIEPCYYGLGFVDAAFQAGHRIVAIVSERDNPRKYHYEEHVSDVIEADIRESGSIIEAIRRSPHAGTLDVILAATDYASAIAAQVSKAFGTKHMPYAAVLKARLKDKTREAIRECHLPNAQFAVVSTFDEAREAAHRIGYPIILKPTDGACSQNVFLVQHDGELLEAFGRVSGLGESYLKFKVRDKYLVEEYIAGEEFSVEIFMQGGKAAFSSVTEKIKSPPPFFAEMAHVVPTSVHTERISVLTKAAEEYMNAVGLKDGCAHVEMRLSPRGPIVMEINPRPGGDHIARDLLVNAFGINLFSAIIDWHFGNPVDLAPKKHAASAIVFLTAKKMGRIKSITGIEDAQRTPGIVKVLIKASIGDPVRPPESSDDRYGYMISVGATPAEAKQIAFKALEKIKLEIE
jgi:biotin carboxylase